MLFFARSSSTCPTSHLGLSHLYLWLQNCWIGSWMLCWIWYLTTIWSWTAYLKLCLCDFSWQSASTDVSHSEGEVLGQGLPLPDLRDILNAASDLSAPLPTQYPLPAYQIHPGVDKSLGEVTFESRHQVSNNASRGPMARELSAGEDLCLSNPLHVLLWDSL